MRNKEVADILYEIADYLEMQDVDFKPRAYRKAARNIEALSQDLAEIYPKDRLEEIEGVGSSIADKISEYLETGKIEYYDKLKKKMDIDIDAITSVQGLGPKSAKKLYNSLGISDLDDLEEDAKKGNIEDINGFGKKTQSIILNNIEKAKQSQERMLTGKAFKIATSIADRLKNSGYFDNVQIVGSYRRRRPTVGDIDILAIATDRDSAMEVFTTGDNISEVLSKGDTKSSIILKGGLQVDLRLIEDNYGAALMYFTGSKDHNVAVRTRAIKNNWKLSEYGMFDEEEHNIAGETEQGIYNKLGMDYIEPELREATGEIEAAIEGNLPDLISVDDIRGDLQIHTKHSDGSNTIREMAQKAEAKNYEYILITDHGPTLQIASGLSDTELLEQNQAIQLVNEDLDITVLHGVETDITENGLGITKETAEELDLVLAAMHNSTENPTDDIIYAFENYQVNILGHPYNRLIHERDPLDLNLDRIVESAQANNVVLEIDSQPKRLDLDWRSVKTYRDKIKYVISTDAHSVAEMDWMHLGVAQARRGWCTKDNILNTKPLEVLLKYFKGD